MACNSTPIPAMADEDTKGCNWYSTVGSGGGRSSAAVVASKGESGVEAATAVKCPRCDSLNTKFCYYNNYSLSQPRHFCKTCRRYWTKGGALRNVPVGGGCRKNRKSKSSSTSTAAATATTPAAAKLFSSSVSVNNSLCSMSIDHHLYRLPIYHGLSQQQLLLPPPDHSTYFQPPGLRGLPLCGFGTFTAPSQVTCTTNTNIGTPFLSFGDLSASSGLPPEAAINPPKAVLFSSSCPMSAPAPHFNDVGATAASASSSSSSSSSAINGGTGNHEILASSMASLSSLNQLLHWKLQQQRLAMFQKDSSASAAAAVEALPVAPNYHLFQIQQPPLPCHVAAPESSGAQEKNQVMLVEDVGPRNGDSASEWCLGSSYTEDGFNPNAINSSQGDWSAGIPTWNVDLHHFNALN